MSCCPVSGNNTSKDAAFNTLTSKNGFINEFLNESLEALSKCHWLRWGALTNLCTVFGVPALPAIALLRGAHVDRTS